jgi:hypothetical protein
MSCCTSSSTFPVNQGPGFWFPAMTPWDGATYEFDFTSWLAPACAALPLMTEQGFSLMTETGQPLTVTSGADQIASVVISASPSTVHVSDPIVGAGTVSVVVFDGVPYSAYMLTATVVTSRGRRGSFTAQFYVEGGPAVSSPYLAVESGYPLNDEFGRLLYWSPDDDEEEQVSTPVYYPPSVTTIAPNSVARVFPAFATGCYLIITSSQPGYVSPYGNATAADTPLNPYVKFVLDTGSLQGLTVFNPSSSPMTVAGARF